MQKNSKVLNLDDTGKELKELYSKRKKQEESVKIIEQNEQYEQRGDYDELDENYEPARSDIEIAEEELYDTNLLIEKKRIYTKK